MEKSNQIPAPLEYEKDKSKDLGILSDEQRSRDISLLELVAQGFTAKEIGGMRSRTEKAIKHEISRARTRLQVANELEREGEARTNISVHQGAEVWDALNETLEQTIYNVDRI